MPTPERPATPQSFSARLTAAIRAKGTPACIGLDPKSSALPPALLDGLPAGTTADGSGPSGLSPAVLAPLYAQFCREVIDVVAPLVPIVKPQLAYFEALGPHGMTALAETIAYAHQNGLLVLADGKRGDIGSTAEAYAAGWLAGPWAADALTVNPYLGLDSIEPFVSRAAAHQAGIFVLVKTSNPGGKDFQDLEAAGSTIYQHVARGVEAAAHQTAGDDRYGAVGAVVGATWPAQLVSLRQAMPHTWILIPGFGHQGGTAADVAGGFDTDGLGALVVSARAVIFAHQRPEMNNGLTPGQWQTAVERACRQMVEQLAAETPAGVLRT
jgi:orotidine-5'-phosphate decarboxylase